ncbi:MAG: hemerythrin domain-containing protein [Thiohalomonadaceae bacterium]
MKRHDALRKLSSDHHSGLVLARRVSRLEDGGDLIAAAENLLKLWWDEIEPHFVVEEQYLLPAFARQTSSSHLLIVETQRQHVMLRAIIDQIDDEQDQPVLLTLRALADALREHIRFEENELFPAIEAALPEEQFLRLQQRMN